MPKRMTTIDLDRIIAPQSVALIGATEDYSKFGGRIMHHLVEHNFAGTIYPINPKRETVLGLTCYSSIEAVPASPDLALLALPAKYLEQAVEACGRAGVGACVIVTAQMGEFSAQGATLEAKIVEIARAYNMRIIGPNCMGMILPSAAMALSSTPTLRYAPALKSGKVAFISQSGAMMGSLFLQAYDHGVGLSGMVSIGNQADVDMCDFLEAYIDQLGTQVICLYIEGLTDPKRFRALCLKARAANKTILCVKAGRTETGSAMAKSHTSSLTGSYSAFETLCRETGVLLLDDTDAMMLSAGVLAENPKAKSDGIGIVCASGGGAAILADRLSLSGLRLSQYGDDTRKALAVDYLDTHQNNPLDLGGHIGGLQFELFQRALDAVYNEPDTGVFVYVFTPQPLMQETLEHIIGLWQRQEKPVILVWNMSRFNETLRQQMLSSGIPHITRTDDLVRALDVVEGDRLAQNSLRTSLPQRPSEIALPQIEQSGFLTEPEAKNLISAYGVPVPQAQSVGTIADAINAAKSIGYPLVLKGVVADIVHKSDLGLVKVGIANEDALVSAFEEIAAAIKSAAPSAKICIDIQQMIGAGVELIVGLKREDDFGPQLVIGAGGIHVELMRDVAQMKAPVSASEALQMLKSLRIWPLLDGARGQAKLDVSAACTKISNLSWLGEDLGDRLVDFEINPFRITSDGSYALDGRGTLS